MATKKLRGGQNKFFNDNVLLSNNAHHVAQHYSAQEPIVLLVLAFSPHKHSN